MLLLRFRDIKRTQGMR